MAQMTEQKVLGLDIRTSVLAGLIACEENRRSAPFLRALVDNRCQVYSPKGADDVIQS
jgi:hypothetical protein